MQSNLVVRMATTSKGVYADAITRSIKSTAEIQLEIAGNPEADSEILALLARKHRDWPAMLGKIADHLNSSRETLNFVNEAAKPRGGENSETLLQLQNIRETVSKRLKVIAVEPDRAAFLRNTNRR